MSAFESLQEESGAARLWVGSLLSIVVFVAGAAMAMPTRIWDRFLWHYFWGPVYADAKAASCAVMTNSGPEPLYQGCEAAIERGAIVAEPGYTVVSEIGYMLILVYMLVGVYLLLERLDIADDPNLYFAFVPFMLLGGALRVVEDGTDRAIDAGVTPLVEYPLNSLIISPIIYGTVFLVTLVSLVGCLALQRCGYIENYYRGTSGVGVTLVVGTLAYLMLGTLSYEYSTLYPSVLLSTVGIASGLSVGLYILFEKYAPEVNAGTSYIGLLVIWGHAIDGVANVILADWLDALSVPLTYYPKHPANAFIIDTTESLQAASLTAVIGTSWPFLFVKLGVASAVVWLFNDQFLEESPRYGLLLLVAVTAVGLGPGTRDMLRATFGI
ncbi:DUF63 family protein [Halomicroarcula sp. S3CR25-11]|jgi:uncharacterized membrane protein|uniref:DUF63 family protein n=2 Tax=Haloarcula TaxID=2237 RepID=A0A8J7YQM4_9EURY|nr:MULTISPECIES: DUF63 family protein [Halomicroarcula]MBX0288785.1 DUF63 family protein [Halomicroarcula salinisoli]MBX0305558.1 DUF63 family protein [Halomicroarcula salinisoli]MDS0283736.1 DUF63 family protein [Halomicroarcula sp. S3CR25-11]